MKRFILSAWILIPLTLLSQPCTINNGTGCLCADGSDTCYLLPDITISWFALETYLSGPTEYSQAGNGADNGRLRITGSTPNIGKGPFTVRGTNYYVCGTDTFYSTSSNVTCPDNSSPTNLLQQRIYKKMGNTITYEDRFAGAQTYHPTHGHNHVDDWVILTLRQQDPNEPDTLKWPIIGSGAKLGFCLMDYGTCDYYNGHCRDRQTYGGGSILTSSNIPNFGMGGGGYSCSPVEQGISVGYTDIYNETLDGMWIDIPPNTCNGNYWIVAQVDPRNNFLESDENNNWTAIPFTLTKQLPAGGAVAEINVDGVPYLCNGSTIDLHANFADSYLWSTGDSTQNISITSPGDYFVQIIAQCGSAVSDTVSIIDIPSAVTDTEQDSTCDSGSLNLVAHGNGILNWYDALTGGNLIDTGFSFQTPVLHHTATYYVENISSAPGSITFSEPHDHSGGLYSGNTFNGYIIFDCLSDFTLKSVKVYTDYPGNRTIELRNSSGAVLNSLTAFVDQGTSRVSLNFQITPGINYQLGTNGNDNQTNFSHVSPDLRRSDNGVAYPYVINGVLSLNDSPFGPSYYYYFYDWEIQAASFKCTSPRQAVSAVVIPLPAVSISGLDSVYADTDFPDTLAGTPAGGTFSGPGITNDSVFDPGLIGTGGPYEIIYSYENENGCENSISKFTNVIQGSFPVGIASDPKGHFSIYPNPSNDIINFSFDFNAEEFEIALYNYLGKEVAHKTISMTKRNLSLNVSQFAKGIYLVEAIGSKKTCSSRFIKN